MKKLLILTSFISFSTMAQTSATLLLKGVIPEVFTVGIVSEQNATMLDLTTNQNDLKVATLNERSNHKLGYKISFSSENHGKLKNDSHSITYTMKYGNQSVNLTGQSFNKVFTNASTVSSDLKISYSGSPDLASGTYTDTVTVTISAN